MNRRWFLSLFAAVPVAAVATKIAAAGKTDPCGNWRDLLPVQAEINARRSKAVQLLVEASPLSDDSKRRYVGSYLNVPIFESKTSLTGRS